jgi:hypothetical protein
MHCTLARSTALNTLHRTTLARNTAQHCTMVQYRGPGAVHCSVFSALNCTAHLPTALHYTALHQGTQNCTAPHYTLAGSTALHSTLLHLGPQHVDKQQLVDLVIDEGELQDPVASCKGRQMLGGC